MIQPPEVLPPQHIDLCSPLHFYICPMNRSFTQRGRDSRRRKPWNFLPRKGGFYAVLCEIVQDPRLAWGLAVGCRMQTAPCSWPAPARSHLGCWQLPRPGGPHPTPRHPVLLMVEHIHPYVWHRACIQPQKPTTLQWEQSLNRLSLWGPALKRFLQYIPLLEVRPTLIDKGWLWQGAGRAVLEFEL